MSLDEKIIAYIDLLGFNYALNNDDKFETLLDLLKSFSLLKGNYFEKELEGGSDENKRFEIRPSVTAFSDSLIISFPLNRILPPNGIISEIRQLISKIALKALDNGFLIRGGISSGRLYHQDGIILGRPFVCAYELEKEAKMPRVVISKSLATEQGWYIMPQANGVEVPDLYIFFNEEEEINKDILSINYIGPMISLDIPSGIAIS